VSTPLSITARGRWKTEAQSSIRAHVFLRHPVDALVLSGIYVLMT